MVIQTMDIRGFKDDLRYIAFNEDGKNACIEFYDRFFEMLRKESYVYYDSIFFETGEPFTYKETYLRLEKGILIEVDNFERSHFYERLFYTADSLGRDMGIVIFPAYTELNSGIMFTSKILLPA